MDTKCKKCDKIIDESLNKHYKRFHQSRTTIFFPDNPNLGIDVRRDEITMRFRCPRCNHRHYEVADNLKKHIEVIHGLPSTRLAVRSNAKKQVQKRGRSKSVVATRISERLRSKSLWRRGDGLTRTQRALARSIHPKKGVYEVAKYLGCSPHEVHAAAKNKMRDTLSQDVLYLDGRKGDIINVDLLDDEPPSVLERPQVRNATVKVKASPARSYASGADVRLLAPVAGPSSGPSGSAGPSAVAKKTLERQVNVELAILASTTPKNKRTHAVAFVGTPPHHWKRKAARPLPPMIPEPNAHEPAPPVSVSVAAQPQPQPSPSCPPERVGTADPGPTPADVHGPAPPISVAAEPPSRTSERVPAAEPLPAPPANPASPPAQAAPPPLAPASPHTPSHTRYPNRRASSCPASSHFSPEIVQAFREADACPVYNFLLGLAKPCDQYLQTFYALGISTSESLRAISRMEDCSLVELKRELMRAGMSLYEYMLVKDGLMRHRIGVDLGMCG